MKVHVLKVDFFFGGKEDALYPVIVENSTEMILIDCGYAGFLPLIAQAAEEKKRSLQNLTGIIITHHDLDHMGGLAELKAAYPHVKIYASAVEEKYISGKEKSLRLVQAETLYDSLPEEYKPGARHFQHLLKAMQAVEVDGILPDSGRLPFMKDMEVLATPGHMPGHISLYLPESKTLIAADAVVYEQDLLEIANPQFTLDLPQTVKSVEKLAKMDIHTLICYHGGVVQGEVRQQLSQLAARYTQGLPAVTQ